MHDESKCETYFITSHKQGLAGFFVFLYSVTKVTLQGHTYFYSAFLTL